MGSYSEEKFLIRNLLNKIAIKETITNPKISVILFTFNSEQHIVNCLFSLAEQTLKDLEIIVIDVGSTDDTCNLLAIFEELDTRFKIITCNKSNILKIKEKVLETTKGTYYSFINSKYYINKNFYEKLYELANKNKSKTIAKLNFHKTNYNKFHQLLYIKATKNNNKND